MPASHLSRRDLVWQIPASNGRVRGTFSPRSPVRPNPIVSSTAALVGVENDGLTVRGMDCIDGTPLYIKSDRTMFTPIARRISRATMGLGSSSS